MYNVDIVGIVELAKNDAYKPGKTKIWEGSIFEGLAQTDISTKQFSASFGERLVERMTNGKIVNLDYDVLCPDGTRIEVKTSKLVGNVYKFNQIRVEKNWDELYLVAYSPNKIRVCRVTKDEIVCAKNATGNRIYYDNNGLYITWGKDHTPPFQTLLLIDI